MGLPRLFVLGDSISMHYGPHLEGMVAGVFEYARKTGENEGEGYEALGIPPDPNGGDSRMVLEYLGFRSKQPGFRPEWLLLNCGLHDIKTDPGTGERQVELARYRANLEAIVGIAREIGARPVWARSTPVDDERHNSRSKEFFRYRRDLEAYNAAADGIMLRSGVTAMDLFAFTDGLGPADEIFCDHVHFTEPVRRLQAAYVAGFVTALAA